MYPDRDPRVKRRGSRNPLRSPSLGPMPGVESPRSAGGVVGRVTSKSRPIGLRREPGAVSLSGRIRDRGRGEIRGERGHAQNPDRHGRRGRGAGDLLREVPAGGRGLARGHRRAREAGLPLRRARLRTRLRHVHGEARLSSRGRPGLRSGRSLGATTGWSSRVDAHPSTCETGRRRSRSSATSSRRTSRSRRTATGRCC